MSDEITIKRMAVIKSVADGLYYVAEWLPVAELWDKVEGTKGYAHSTSAYAKLGWIVSKEMQNANR